MKCRHCNTTLTHKFLDLGSAPPSNAYLTQEQLHTPELYFPLRLFVCDHCWLVQTEDFADAELFFSADYAYFSSISKSWLAHAKGYSEMITEFLSLSSDSLVVEVASNDGYLLKNFVEKNIPCLGVEPTLRTAEAAEKLGIPVIKDFFGESLAKKLVAEGKKADLIAGNNVYAHVPDINDFTRGIKELLKPEGVVTLEFPHLAKLLEFNQFDTVYHEHFSYLSLATVNQIFKKTGLRLFKVEELSTHGGSLRVFGCLHESKRVIDSSVSNIIEAEKKQGLQGLDIYNAFQNKVDYIKNQLLKFLIAAKEENMKVVAYGAAAKGNTLLNYAGIKPDLLPLVCDAAPSKQNKYMPGSHVPIASPEEISTSKADYVIILPWNLKQEIVSQLQHIKAWQGKFVTLIPEISIID